MSLTYKNNILVNYVITLIILAVVDTQLNWIKTRQSVFCTDLSAILCKLKLKLN